MRRERIRASGIDVTLLRCRVCVVGSGAAALNGAVHLGRLGVSDILIVTERLGGGASANAGSDKQTYCRVTPAAAGGDGVIAMAEELFAGGAMHGDIALVEAALSEREFYHLVELGVPFPHDRYGICPGYRTDHDSRGRGSSAGPLTSRFMYERLYDEACRLSIPIIDGVSIIELVTEEAGDTRRVTGLVGMDRACAGRGDDQALVAVRCDYVIYAVGGAGGLFRDSVYPPDQVGGLGAPLRAGAIARNLAESQFGIASVGFRWNLSGSYQQVVPRYVSTDGAGGDEREFLADAFPDPDRLFTAQFLKGYQWPFDVKKIANWGSSMVDLLVFNEVVNRGRRVFLDFSANPSHGGTVFSVESAPDVVRRYLEGCAAEGDTPIIRLRRMNEPAFDLFLRNGIDLAHQKVPAAVCHQHVNGGLAGSIWWESNIQNLFPVGECSGSHGVYRPGGAALNAGQVGSLRAAQMIAHRIATSPARRPGRRVMKAAIERLVEALRASAKSDRHIDPDKERLRIQGRMSRVMGIVRNLEDIRDAARENREMIEAHRRSGPGDPGRLHEFVRNEDLLITERAFLASAECLIGFLGGPRGSFLMGRAGDIPEHAGRTAPPGAARSAMEAPPDNRAVECVFTDDITVTAWPVSVRPIPKEDDSFETIWAAYRGREVYRDR